MRMGGHRNRLPLSLAYPHGIKPWKKKIDAILHLKPPHNINELRAFLGMVNYYCDMWPSRTHTLAPLTAMTGKAPFHWSPIHQKAFEQMKAIISADALLAYPNPDKQDNRPATYFLFLMKTK